MTTDHQTYVETNAGELVEIINGTLVCLNHIRNWNTIADWLSFEPELAVSIKVSPRDGASSIFVDFPESVPTRTVLSLLEHFEYQK